MAWTQSDIDRLDAQIATGVLVAEFRSGDHTEKQQLRSLNEMLRLRQIIQASLSTADRSFAARRTVAGYDNGL